MRLLTTALFATALTSLASAQITAYSQDCEGLNQADPQALELDGWLVFGNAFDSGGGYLYGYGPFPAPNGTGGFCNVVNNNQGGVDQGAQQIVAFSDYNNGGQGTGETIEGNTYREWFIDASDVGKTWTFTFDAKRGDLVAPSTASAFIKVLETVTWGLTAFEQVHTDAIPTTWGSYSLSFTPQASDIGSLFQIGFLATATNFDASGVFYDNIVLSDVAAGPFSNYCISTANSTGAASTISATGSGSIAANDLVLTADSLPDQPGIFICGDAQAQVPFFNGFLCVAPATLQRFNTVNFPAGGSITQAVDLATSANGGINAMAGASYFFQRWNRDPAGGGGAANFSDGLEVMYTP